jgi:aldose 1-epimerase
MAVKNIEEKVFGVLSDGNEAKLYTLKSGSLTLSLTNYGGTLVSLFAPDRNGKSADILLGYSTLGPYTRKGFYIGATIGRFGNRVAKAQFTLNGKKYALFDNDGGNSLHGGRFGFDRKLWAATPWEDDKGAYVTLTLDSPDGEEGYPGNLQAKVTYGITKNNTMTIDYQATVDAECPVNLTNHSYYNLAGAGYGTVMGHVVKLYSSGIVAVDASLIPTGKITPVAGGPFDFSAEKPVERDAAKAAGGPNGSPGYDHCFTVDGEYGQMRPAAEVYEPLSGRTMKVSATQPGIQFYTGNFLTGAEGKDGAVYGPHTGFCLETQHFPDSPNQSAFLSPIFGPKRPYHERTEFEFGVR